MSTIKVDAEAVVGSRWSLYQLLVAGALSYLVWQSLLPRQDEVYDLKLQVVRLTEENERVASESEGEIDRLMAENQRLQHDLTEARGRGRIVVHEAEVVR